MLIFQLAWLALFGIVADGSRDWYWTDFDIANGETSWSPRLVGEPVLVVSRNDTPHEDAVNMESNNNVAAIITSEGIEYLAWRTSPMHFASTETRLNLVRSVDNGTSWNFETNIYMGSDLREPLFVEANGRLFFYFFQAGTNIADFEPKGLFWMERLTNGSWSTPKAWGHYGEVVWDVVMENGTLYSQSYSGNYSLPGTAQDMGQLSVYFNRSTDGLNWEPVGVNSVYYGGLTEIGFQFDLDGNLWGVGRNEDGDDSGWGSRLFFAPASDLSAWEFPQELSNVWIYESPRMFRHGDELYLVGRTDPDGPFWSRDNTVLNELPAWEHHLYDLVSFSFRQHGTAIWRVNRENKHLEKVLDLVGCGDTAFPSIVRLSEHKFAIWNYSNSLDKKDCPPNWIMGQVSPAGSLIYKQVIEFVPESRV